MQPLSIVLVEDNLADVFLVNRALEEAGLDFELLHYDNGVDALAALGSNDERHLPGAILIDINTPRMDGFSVLRRLKEKAAFDNVPMAIITSSRAPHDRERAEASGARFIQKPSTLDEFLASVGGAVREMVEESHPPLPHRSGSL